MTTLPAIENITRATTAFKILSDPTRFKILCLLAKAQKGLCVFEIAEGVGISHSAASHQLSTLEARGVVEAFRDGQNMCYEMIENALNKNLRRFMQPFTHS